MADGETRLLFLVVHTSLVRALVSCENYPPALSSIGTFYVLLRDSGRV
jgi:hypothetical protein